MELADLASVFFTQPAAPVGQQPQHLELFVGRHGRSPDIRVPTNATEWASVASVFLPCPVANIRTRAGETWAGRRRPPGPRRGAGGRCVDRSRCSPPLPRLGPASRPRRPVDREPSGVGREATAPTTVSSAVITTIVTDRLCEYHPDHDPCVVSRLLLGHDLPPDYPTMVGSGGHRCFEQSNPFLSHSRPAASGLPSHERADTANGGQPDERATNPDTSTEPRQHPIVASMKQAADVSATGRLRWCSTQAVL